MILEKIKKRNWHDFFITKIPRLEEKYKITLFITFSSPIQMK